MRDKLLFYDVESYPNYFMACFRMRANGKKKDVILRVDDPYNAEKFFANEEYWQINFNGGNYDDIMIAYWIFLGADATDERMYAMNQYLIEGDKSDLMVNAFIAQNIEEMTFQKWGNDRVNRYFKYGCDAIDSLGGRNRKVIDLLMLGEKQGSLKNAAVVLKHNTLEEAPVEFGQVLKDEEKALVDHYCWHDVEVTEKVYNYYEKVMQVRDEFYQTYNIKDAHNIGSAKLAEKYLIGMHGSALNSDDPTGNVFKSWVNKARIMASEEKKGAKVLELTSAYPDLDFDDKGMVKLWSMLKQSYLSFKPIVTANVDIWQGESANFDEYKKNMQEASPYFISGQAICKGDLLITDDRDNDYKFGVGGLHNDAPKGLWKSDDDHVVWNVDVTSYYPSLIQANGFAPKHFPEFSRYIRKLLADRRRAKAAGNKIESDAKKLVLNSSFGKTKDKFSILFEPKAHFSVTLCGQLLLLRLIDMIHNASETAELINANTDGVCFYVKRSDLESIREACRQWEDYSRVELEEELYDSWYQSACNGYCALQDNGYIKSKGGDYKLKPSALKETYAKSPALKKAVIFYTMYGTPIEETLESLEPSEFCMSVNLGAKTKLYKDDELDLTKVFRYVYTKDAKHTFNKFRTSDSKIMKIGQGRPLEQVNVLSDLDANTIDRAAYARDAKEMIMDILFERKQKALPKKIRDNIDVEFANWEKS